MHIFQYPGLAVEWCVKCRTLESNQLIPLYYQAKGLRIPDSKVHGAHMGPIWGQQDPDVPTLQVSVYVQNTINFLPVASSVYIKLDIIFNKVEYTQYMSYIHNKTS